MSRTASCTASAHQFTILQWNDGNSQVRSTIPGPERIRFDRGVSQPLAPRGVWKRDYPPRAQDPTGPYVIAWPVCSPGSGVPAACAPGGQLLSPPCQSSTPGLLWRRSSHPLLPGFSLLSLSIWTLLVVRRNTLEGMIRANKDSLLAFCPALHRRDVVAHITVNLGKALACVGGSWHSAWYFDYGPIGWDKQLRVYQSVFHICQNL